MNVTMEQQQRPPQGGHFAPVATSSTSTFTPLPPIRRTSTFDLLRKKGLLDDDSDTAPSPIEKDSPPTSHAAIAQQTRNGQSSAGQSASHASPHSSAQATPGQNSRLNFNPALNNFSSHPHGQGPSSLPSQQPQRAPNGPVGAGPTGPPGAAQQPGFMQMHQHQAMMGRGGPAGAPQLPPGQWTAQESNLTEPLNVSNRNRSTNSPQAYQVYDKETEGDVPRPPPQPLQTRSRTSSASAPPTAAMRYPELFSATSRQHPTQGPVPLSQQHPLLRGQNNYVGPRESMDLKETGVRIEQTSVSSIASEEANEKSGRRASTSLFGLGHRRNSSTQGANQQTTADGHADKKKKFFASVAGIAHSQPKSKPAPGLAPSAAPEDTDQASLDNHGETAPVKKRLSELKGMIKGVGNAKEGAKDDQPGKVETVYESRPSMQAPPPQRPPEQLASPPQPGPFGYQAQQNSFGPRPSMQAPPPQPGEQATMNTPPFSGIPRVGTGASQPAQSQSPAKGEDGGKKGATAGFLGGLFHKQGTKAKEVKSPSPQPTPTPQPSQRPMQPPPMQMQMSHLPFRPGQLNLPGQQLGPHPMLAGQPPTQRPGQSQAPTTDPSQPAPFLQTAQIVTIRRPSEITVSTQSHSGGSPQPNNHRMPSGLSPQASQVSLRQHAGLSPLRQQPNQTGAQKDGSIAPSQTSPLSDNSGERLTAAPPTVSRIAPNRKPVGSANSRNDGHYMTSAIPAAGARPERPTASPSPRPGEQQRAPSQLPLAQQSPLTTSSEGEKDVRPPSLPSLVPSPAPSNNSSFRTPGGQLAGESPDLRGSEHGLGVFQNGLTPPGPVNSSAPGGGPNALRWGPNGFRPMAPPLIPPSADDRVNPDHATNSPAPSMDQGKLSKFFGAYDGGKPAPQPQANKERSAASKFLGAFKRSSKNNDTSSSSQHRPRTSPQVSQTPPRPGMPAPGPDRPPAPPGPLGPPGPAGAQMQAGRGQHGQIPPNGMFMQGQLRQGPMPPGMVQGGPGQMPPQMQRPGPPTKAVEEPLYDQVPIPRGYEAVHGYGPGTLLAPSPYNAGRPGVPPMLPPGYRLQPIDPRALQASQAGIAPGPSPAARNMPPGWPGNALPQQSGQPLPRGPVQNVPPNMQNLGPLPPQGQFPPQHFVQRPPGQPTTTIEGAQPGQVPQTQPNATWQGPSDKRRRSSSSTPLSHQTPTPNSARHVSAQGIPLSSSPASSGTATPQSHRGSAAAQAQTSPSSLAHTHVHQDSSPTPAANPAIAPPPRASVQSQEGVKSSPGSTTSNSTGGHLRSPDATRLTSRMSVSRHSANNGNTKASASLAPAKFEDRTMSVSPEPHGTRHGDGPVHQVSNQDLSVNVDRANSHVRNRSEDIYDATPRLHNTAFQSHGPGETQAHENTKYAGADRNRLSAPTNGTLLAGGAATGSNTSATSATGDNMSFLDGPDDSETDDGQTPNAGGAEHQEESDVTISPPQRSATITVTMEPEEKILVDEPVELAAVNDDDDGLPMMTATSYPGQEWNPYGAGEFGDWE